METPPELGTLLATRNGMGQRERLSGGTPPGGEPPCLSRGMPGVSCLAGDALPALLPPPGAAHLVRPSQPERGGFAGRICGAGLRGARTNPPPPRTAHTHTSHGGRKGSVCLGHTDTQTDTPTQTQTSPLLPGASRRCRHGEHNLCSPGTWGVQRLFPKEAFAEERVSTLVFRLGLLFQWCWLPCGRFPPWCTVQNWAGS